MRMRNLGICLSGVEKYALPLSRKWKTREMNERSTSRSEYWETWNICCNFYCRLPMTALLNAWNYMCALCGLANIDIIWCDESNGALPSTEEAFRTDIAVSNRPERCVTSRKRPLKKEMTTHWEENTHNVKRVSEKWKPLKTGESGLWYAANNAVCRARGNEGKANDVITSMKCILWF